MSSELHEVINLLDGDRPLMKRVDIGFRLTHQSPHVEIAMYGDSRRSNFTCELQNPGDWEGLGKAIGGNTIVGELRLDTSGSGYVSNRDNEISGEVFQCIETLYGGIRLNTSIYYLCIDMDLFPCDGSLPTLNLHDAQFKEVLKYLMLKGRRTISNNQSVMVETFLESTFLEELIMQNLEFESANESAFRRIILACSRVERLDSKCLSLSQCDSIASLLGDPTSILSDLSLPSPIDKEGLSTIAAGLVSNKTLKKFNVYSWRDSSPIAQALCDTSSIDRIIASNHTLESVSSYSTLTPPLPLLQDYLALNNETNKEGVIRTKIARYYFKGEFDVSTFASIDIKCLPGVLAMIGGGETNRNAAIFRKGDAVHQ